jgi:hypothetical protein
MGLAGCGETGTTTGTDGERGTASDCKTTDAGALVSTTDTDEGLAASAVTSSCDEVAVYTEDGDIRTVAITTESGDTVVADFDSKGQLVVAREDGGDTVSASYNEGLSYARVSEDIDDTVSASILAVDRETDTNARSAQQNDERPEFCAQLDEFTFIMTEGCDEDPPPARCDGAFAEAARAAREICEADRVETFDGIDGLKFTDEREMIPLGIDGFVTTRPAETGTTFILTSVPFGGMPPYEVVWTQESGESTTLTELPGGAAVGDSEHASGQFGFMVEVTDQAGESARMLVPINLGEQFIGVVAQANTTSPDVDEVVEFFAAPRSTLEMFGTAQDADSGLDFKVYWDFGDGSPGLTGEQVEHAYAEPGVYTVSLIVVAGVCDFNDYLTIHVGGATDDQTEFDRFAVHILTSNDSLKAGDSVILSPEPKGGIEPIEYAWGIVEGEDGVASLTEVAPTSALFAFSELVELVTSSTASRPIVVGVVAVDATGRVAEAIKPLPVCSADGGLFANLVGPFDVKANDPTPLNAFVVSCNGDEQLTYDWAVIEGSATIDDRTSPKPMMTATNPGELVVVELQVTDTTGNVALASIGTFVLLDDFGDLFAEFLGPHDIPMDEEVPVFSFIAGGEPPYFCNWHVDDPERGKGLFLDPFSCEPHFKANEPGCLQGELRVEDAFGNIGFAFFEICSGSGAEFAFDCPPDNFCDEECDGFDPDCGDPCPFDGFCDEFCPIGDPDCFENNFCAAGDEICDHFCEDETGVADEDCASCGQDGVCVFFCAEPDPDCGSELCARDDGICDFGCEPPDPDCEFMPCVAGDGFCDFNCSEPDPDCPQGNDELCEHTGFCCPFDDFCDPECPEPDLGCEGCGEDGVCVHACPEPDPDCGINCDPAFDPNCQGMCGDGFCDFTEDCLVCSMDCGPCQACTTDAECEDGDPCTDAFCEMTGTGVGACIVLHIPDCFGDPCQDLCDDGDPCTIDDCDPAGDCVHHPDPICGTCADGLECDDGDPCTMDSCGSDGMCHHDVVDPNCVQETCLDDAICVDADPCTLDYCGTDGLCKHDPITGCTAGGGCTTDAECDDGDPCTIDTCPMDGTPCHHDTDPSCVITGCVTDADCDDGNPCTTGTCQPDGLCSFTTDAACMCGNGTCDLGEDNVSCPADCP